MAIDIRIAISIGLDLGLSIDIGIGTGIDVSIGIGVSIGIDVDNQNICRVVVSSFFLLSERIYVCWQLPPRAQQRCLSTTSLAG